MYMYVYARRSNLVLTARVEEERIRRREKERTTRVYECGKAERETHAHDGRKRGHKIRKKFFIPIVSARYCVAVQNRRVSSRTKLDGPSARRGRALEI